MSALSALFNATAKALRPPPKLQYSVWAAENFRLPAETSAISGRYRPWKFQRIMLDLIGDPMIEQVSIPKGTRLGYTKCLVAAIAADAANDPCPIIVLTPTDDDARGMVVDEIDPAFRETPALQGLMKVGRFDGRNTLTQRALLGGGSLKILSARAPRNLRRHTARKLYCDEVDGMEVTNEGDPIKLGIKRTESYGDRKIVMGSTPTDEVTSIIWRAWTESDQGIFEVPCPHCQEFFELLWDHIEYDKADLDAAHARCPHCGCEIDERHKPQMVEAGRRRVLKPEIKHHAGFRLSALVSLQPNASWGKLAREYEEAKRAGPHQLQVFHNTVLGMPWSSTMDHVGEHELMRRMEPWGLKFDIGAGRWREEIPTEVLYITAGVDVQVDRFEVVLWGWSRDGQRFCLGHEVIRGATNVETTWADLDALLSTTWRHPYGGRIGIEAAGIDSGDGNRTQFVYDFCGPRMGRRIVPVKGVAGPRAVIEATTSKKSRRASSRLYLVGVDQVKTDILTSMGIERGNPSCLRFSDGLDESWFIQFTSERRKISYTKGRPVVEFERIGYRAAEALDASVYAIAVRNLCRFDFDRREPELFVANAAPKSVLKSAVSRLHGIS